MVATPENPSGRTLFIRHKAFGDVLLTTPFLRLVQQRDPDALIDLYSEIDQIHPGLPGFRKRIPMPQIPLEKALKLGHGTVYWFSYEQDPTLHILDGYELSTGLHLEDRTLMWTVLPDERKWAESLVTGLEHPLLGFSADGHNLRSLSQEKVQSIVDQLRISVKGSLIVTARLPMQLKGCINLTGQLASMRQLGALISLCDAWLTTDSGPLHLAQALSIPTIGLFGPTLPELRITRPSNSFAVRNETLDCLGCHHTLPAGAEQLEICKRGDHACMKNLDEICTAQTVLAALAGESDPLLQERISRYGDYRLKRMSQWTEATKRSAVAAFQSRIRAYIHGPSLLRRLERGFRNWRKSLWNR